MDELEKLNFSDHVIKQIKPWVDIATNELGITTFGYRRFLLTGESFGFSSDPNWNRKFLENFSGMHILEYEHELQDFLLNDKAFFVKAGVPRQDSEYLNALFENNIWNTLTVYKHDLGDDKIEAFFFCATKDNNKVVEIHLNNHSIIENFISMLQTKVNSCMMSCPKEYFKPTVTLTKLFKKAALNFGVEGFERHNHDLVNNGLKNNVICFTYKESAILDMLSKKHGRKNIAEMLKIAPSTFDSYVERLKRKTGVLTITQLREYAYAMSN